MSMASKWTPVRELIVWVAVAALAPAVAAGADPAPEVRLRGAVADPIGGAIDGAVVTAVNTETGERTAATADGRGRYRLAVTRGLYRVEAVAPHFAPAAEEVLLAGDGVLDFELPLARVYDSVHVIERSRGELLAVPGGVAEVGSADIEEASYGNVAEALRLQPGVLARSRFGADEVQFSVRGSGLRNNFHARGINLLFNGRPYMDADGFGDLESLDLMATERIELWKGANALRFGGNQAGGAVNFVTPTGGTAPELMVRALGGAFGLFKAQVASGGVRGPLSYYASFSATQSDGYRDHSAQERRRVFSNLEWELSADTDLRFDLVYAGVSEQLPGALTRAEFAADPRRADPNNRANRFGRDYDFVHAGFALDHRLDEHNVISWSVHGHVRDVVHPIFQVLDQVQRTVGADLAWRRTGERARLLLGVAPQGGGNQEARFANLGGERGALTARFATDVVTLGAYGELQFDATERLVLIAGGRWDSSRREFDDRFLDDGDRSDARTFEALSPKLGALWTSGSGIQVFGNLSRAYEPPLLLELTSFGDSAGFIDLEAQDVWQYELGTRGARGPVVWDVALFDWEVENEIVNVNLRPFPGAPFTIPSYRNAEKTRHLGLEVGGAVHLGDATWRGAYTWSRFTYVDDPEFGDNDLPGAPEHAVYSELRWQHPSGWWIAPNLDASLSPYPVDSANTTENERFVVLGLKAGLPLGRVELSFEASNLSDEDYSGSVQVDNALGRYLEPGNGRALYVGLGWRHE
jgi:iron complex outermembrane receptor protein